MTTPSAVPAPVGATAPQKRKGLKRDIFRLVVVVFFFGLVAYGLQLPGVRSRLFDIAHLREDLQNFGASGAAVFILAGALLTGVGVPRLWVCAIAGGVYGAALGIIYGTVGTLLGALLNFYTGRFILRGPMKRRLPSKMRKWYDRFGENGFRWILYVRLFPLSNATIVNLVCGASAVRVRDFILATIIGYMPFTISFALFGSSAAKGQKLQLILGALAFASVFLGRQLWKRFRTPAEAAAEDDDEADTPLGDDPPAGAQPPPPAAS